MQSKNTITTKDKSSKKRKESLWDQGTYWVAVWVNKEKKKTDGQTERQADRNHSPDYLAPAWST